MLAAFDIRRRLLAILLAALAGYVDALGFLALGGLFVSFMSGNSTQLAVGLASNKSLVGIAGGLIACFLAGVILGALMATRAGRRRKPAVLLLVAVSLSAAALLAQLGTGRWSPFVLAVAMGVQNAVFLKDGEVAVGVTYMTGALVKMGHRLAAALQGGEHGPWLAYLQLWLGLVTGAVVGSLAFGRFGLAAIWPAAAETLLLALFAIRLKDP